jgi:hypothetical protein
MSKKHLKLPPALSFSGALSATLQKALQKSGSRYAFPEHTRPLGGINSLNSNPFRSIVGHSFVKSSTFVLNQKGKVWQEQSLT